MLQTSAMTARTGKHSPPLSIARTCDLILILTNWTISHSRLLIPTLKECHSDTVKEGARKNKYKETEGAESNKVEKNRKRKENLIKKIPQALLLCLIQGTFLGQANS